MRPAAMLEQVNALPGAERRLAVHDRNRQLNLRQRRAQMRRHVVGAFVIVLITSLLFRRQLLEECFQIGAHFPGRILLNEQRRRGVLAENGEQPSGDILRAHPATNLARDLHQTATSGANVENVSGLAHEQSVKDIDSDERKNGAAEVAVQATGTGTRFVALAPSGRAKNDMQGSGSVFMTFQIVRTAAGLASDLQRPFADFADFLVYRP
jgi:hypothetical protein